MRRFCESQKAAIITRVLSGAGGLTVLVTVLAAGRKFN
ncbi:MAG: hypothetical protein QOI74_1120 [Micromonosporaceae bacterium]|jgi:hypothetical protein|nr:hypothetical protein [Micromonosporaceae bacterium]MDT5035203.1 hypothetical protein [Micromonosporaceae bacterium]